MVDLEVVYNDFLSSCTYIFHCVGGTILIDPGSNLEDYLLKVSLAQPVFCLITHAHVDHFIGLNYLKDYEPKVYFGRMSLEYVECEKLNRLRYTDFTFSFGGFNIQYVEYDTELQILDLTFVFCSAPGHSRDSSYIVHGSSVFCGDVLNPDGSVFCKHKDSNELDAMLSIKRMLSKVARDNLKIHFGHYRKHKQK